MTNREPSAAEIKRAIVELTTTLVAAGLVDDQEWPSISTASGATRITTVQDPGVQAIRADTYDSLYRDQAQRRAFNFVMLDKALVHLSYEFHGQRLRRHRLSFLPAPDLMSFQADPEEYLRERHFVEVVGRQAVGVPLRFDFDARDDVTHSEDHPASHLTLGQYQHCRIPVAAAITPWVFVDFIVRHFYAAPGVVAPDIDRRPDRRFLSLPPELVSAVQVSSPGNR